MQTKSRISIVAARIMMVCGLLVAGSSAWAEGGVKGTEDGPSCTLKTLKGRYLVAEKGTVLPPAFGVTEPTPAANAGFHVFNGDGTGTDIVTFRLNGITVLENAVVPISYTVNADCTGTIEVLVPDGPTFGIFIAPDGSVIAMIAKDPGNAACTISRRVSRN